MEQLAQPLDGQMGVVGLVIENSMSREAFFITMLCVPRLDAAPRMGVRSDFAVPGLGRKKSQELRASALSKALRPVLGELAHFAGGLPGGIPVHERFGRQGERLGAAFAIQKKVLGTHWEQSVQAAATFSKALADAVPFVRACSQALEPLGQEFGFVSAPSMDRFAQIAIEQSRLLDLEHGSGVQVGPTRRPGRF